MKVLFVTDDFLPGLTGVGVHAQQVAKALVELGHEVIVLTSCGLKNSFFSQTEIWEKIKIFRTRTLVVARFPQSLPLPSEVAAFLKTEKPDLIHYHYLSLLAIFTSKEAKKLKISEVTTYHFNPDILTQPWFMRPFKHVIRKMAQNFYNHMLFLITPSNSVKKELIANGYQTSIIHLYNPLTFKVSEILTRTKKNESGFIILYVGRMAVEKNISYLITAFFEFLKIRPDALLWLVGSGPSSDSLKLRCKDLGIEKSVVFFGHIEHQDLASYYQKCDVFMLPSLVETLSLVSIEAMSFKKPIIVTDQILCSGELVEHTKNGFIVNSKDPMDLVGRLKELAADQTLLEQMGEAAFLHSKKFSLESFMKNLLDLYNQVLKK